jgi:peptide/nickel transport system substrate-binding protein
LRLTFKTSTNPRSLRIATVFQQQLARVGIDLELRSYDWGTFYGDIKAGKFQLYSLSWVGLKMPDVYRYIFHSDSIPPVGANRGRLADAQVDRLIEKAENSPDMQDKAAIYARLQERLHSIKPYVPLWYEDNIVVTAAGLSGYRPAADGSYDGLTRVRYPHAHESR